MRNEKKNQIYRIMKMMSVFILIVMVLSLMIQPSSVFADAGGQISHSSGGSSGGGFSSSGGLGGSLFLLSSPEGLIILAIILVIGYMSNKSKEESRSRDISRVYSQENTNITNEQELNVIRQIQSIDPNFDEELFKAWSEEVFVTLQEAWSERQWKKIRPFESDALFQTHNRQLNDLIARGLTNRVERVAVRDVKISEFENNGSNETVSVIMKVSLRDYYVDDHSGKVTEGDPHQEIFVTYKLKFVRTAGVKTTALSTKSVTSCPNCGAPTEITSSGQCPYCKSVITTGKYTFVLASLKVLSQHV